MRFILHCRPEKIEKTGFKIAIIGSGPAGLVASGYLACMGHEVHVYDRLPEPGGLMMFAIPSERIPKQSIRVGVEELKKVGVHFYVRTKVISDGYEVVGDDIVEKTVNFEDIVNNYDAVLIATGTWRCRRLGIPGEELEGTYTALDFLYRRRLEELGYEVRKKYKIGKKIAIIGAGLAAIDVAYELLKMKVENVMILYRRTINEAPAGRDEIRKLISRGVRFIELVGINKIIGKDKVEALELIKMKLTDKVDKRGRRMFEPIPGTEHYLEVDNVVLAVGEEPTPPFRGECCGIRLRSDGTIEVDDRFRTSRFKVFAAGDVVTGPSRIGNALKTGLEAAKNIHKFLTTGNWNF